MDELVPMNPDRNPAAHMAPRVGRKATRPRLSHTATSTDIPSHKPSVRWSIQKISSPPATVPGTRPKIAYCKPRSEIAARKRQALANDKVSAAMVIGAGT